MLEAILSTASAEWLDRRFGWEEMRDGWDGDAYCILIGPDLQQSHARVGTTPADALDALVAEVRP